MKSWTPFVGASLLLLAFSVEGEENGSNSDILHEIVHRTKRDANIDISLSKISHEETCNIITPNGETVLAENVNIPGVTVRNSSYFVSCRITIGPINESLLGNWSLCGEYKDKNEPHKRCQPVSISWYNPNNSSQTWNLWPEPKSDYVVSYDGNLSPVLTGSGTVSTCHAVTPNGEELVITADTDYPGLTRVGTNEACNFNIGPINKYYIGDWKLFGLFNSPLMGLIEVSRPMHLFLYDEENPYSQAYNVTNEDQVTYIINLGSTIIEEINGRGNLATDDCQIISSFGQKYSISDSKELDPVVFKDVGSNIACRVAIGPITEEMLGKWNFSGKFSNSDTFTERRRVIEIVKEDPANPIIDENRIVDILDTQFFNTSIGASHTILIKDGNTKESCHLRTPAGLQYTIMEGFNIPGIEVIEDDPDVTCGITVNVKSEDLIGEWILIARVSNYFERIERRLPFIVYVEEIVRAIPQEVTITEGNTLYLRLEKPTELKDSCVLYGPNHNLTDFETDRYYNDKCGFIIKDIEKSDDGMWEIRYGMGIKYRAFIDVIVIASWNKTIDNLEFIKDRPIKAIIGPKNAIYCKLEDPSGRIVYDNFGKCTIELEKVTKQHNGRWIMTVGFPGKIIAEEYFFNVKITEAERKAIVTTSIEEQKPEVILTCSVPTEYEVKTCKFRKPSGRVLLAVEGVGESGYTFHGVGTSMESAIRIHECGLRISNLQSDDLGIWRCAVQTANDTYYGFLTVLYSWALQDSEVTAPIIIEPNLITTHRSVDVLQGDTVTMSCSIQSAIEYCYFRAQNGTIFNLSPGMSLNISMIVR
ncbi:uncharacterized protein LOC128201355 [Galleria mellonella]|uniref:Uncharacterized protein LOC128201355 n=1 Tax=Galleria mellonella TaxID=7137 RepID=A0ABM3MS43_GALME|nr:uncharacterized protein LOC128201355 [Galleria mellonella]